METREKHFGLQLDKSTSLPLLPDLPSQQTCSIIGKTASVDLLSMPPMTLQVSNSGRLLHNGAQADAQGVQSLQQLSVPAPNLRESRNSFGSQGSIDSFRRGRVSPSMPHVLSDTELDDSKLLAMFGLGSTPVHSSASDEPTAEGEVVDSECRAKEIHEAQTRLCQFVRNPQKLDLHGILQALQPPYPSAQGSSLLAELHASRGDLKPQRGGKALDGSSWATRDASSRPNLHQKSQQLLPRSSAQQAVQQAGKDSQCSISALVQKPKGGDLNSEPTEALAWPSASNDGADTGLENILREGRPLSAGQEADLLAHCNPEGKGNLAASQDNIREESILAGLGVLAPEEIGCKKLSKTPSRSGGGLLAELRRQRQRVRDTYSQIAAEPLGSSSGTNHLSEILPTASGVEALQEAPYAAREGQHHFAREDSSLPQQASLPLTPTGSTSFSSLPDPSNAQPDRSGGSQSGREGHLAPLNPLLEFGSGALAAKAAGQNLSPSRPAVQSPQHFPHSPLELLSPRSTPILSRASSPVLSTFGSGSIASAIAKGSCLQSWQSSPVCLGSSSTFNSGSELGQKAWRSGQNSPTVSADGNLHQSLSNSSLRRSPGAVVTKLEMTVQGDFAAEPHRMGQFPKRGMLSEGETNLPRKRPVPVIPSSIFSREDAPGWRPLPSPPRTTGNIIEEPANSRFWTVHSLNSWAKGDKMLQSRRSSLVSKSSIQSQPSFHSWAGPGPGLETPSGSKMWSKVNNGGTIEFIRQPLQPQALLEEMRSNQETIVRSAISQQGTLQLQNWPAEEL